MHQKLAPYQLPVKPYPWWLAWPFLIGWLHGQEWTGAGALFYAACALYVVGFFFMVAAVYSAICEWEGK